MEARPKVAGQKHILVVDDNLELAQTYKELFEAHGYKVSSAPNGVLALKLILNMDVDAILCDLSMPQLEGDMFYVTVERVRPHLTGRFIFVTGNVDNPRYESFLKRVNSPVLNKPVAIERLLGAITGVMASSA